MYLKKTSSPWWQRADDFASYADANTIRNCPTCKAKFSAEFNIPDIWWTEYNRKTNGFFGSQDVLDDAEKVSGYGTRAQCITLLINAITNTSKLHGLTSRPNKFSPTKTTPTKTTTIIGPKSTSSHSGSFQNAKLFSRLRKTRVQ